MANPELPIGLDERLQHIRWQFEATPGLAITLEEARALWALDPAYLRAILEAFVDVRFLQRLDNGAYCRRADALQDAGMA